LIESLGDTEFSSPEHHGTPAQRVHAIEAGYAYGKTGNHVIAEAAREGSKLVLNQFA
jgi:predicted metalloprotease